MGSYGAWIGFIALVLAMIAVDLGVRQKDAVVSFKEAAIWSVVWISLAMVFNGWIYYTRGSEAAMEFFAGYLVEKSLSVDNLFVFLIIFKYFSVPPVYQHRVLVFGILGALVMRAIFIFLGATLINSFHWVMYIFGGIVMYSGYKLLTQKDEEIHPENNPLFRLATKVIPSISEFHEQKFFVKQEKRLVATPLLHVLLAIEISDLVFAIDSIPAIFAITTDTYIVFTSNIFAILGLRSLYFLLSGALTRLHYLNYGLSAVLIFIGAKMLIIDFYKVPIAVSLTVIASIIGLSAVLSLITPAPKKVTAEEPEAEHKRSSSITDSTST